MPYVLLMARITVRNLEDWVMQRLRERGSARGVSMEQEARDVLYASLGMPVSEGFEGRDGSSAARKREYGREY